MTVSLTYHERQVIELIVGGLSNRDISRLLGVSVAAVKRHVQRLLDKFGTENRIQLAVAFTRQNLMSQLARTGDPQLSNTRRQ